MRVDPEKYLIRSSKNRWALFPFTEDVALDLRKPFIEFPINFILTQIAEIDVSMVVDPVKWDVIWVHGAEVTQGQLFGMCEYAPLKVATSSTE